MRSPVQPHRVALGVATLCAMVSFSAAQAAEKESAEEKAVEIRQSIFHLMEWNYTPTIGAMLKNQMEYDPALVQKNAARLEALALMIPDAFSVDTHAATGIKTRARAAIWTSMADFKAKSDDLVKAIDGLQVAAKSDDVKAFRQAAITVGKACGACHDNFREK